MSEQDGLIKPTWGLFFATLLLAIITGFLAYYTFQLYSETVMMGEITKSGIESSNKHTEKSIDLAEKNFEIENRAFIAMDGFANLKIIMGKTSAIDITIKNFGHTPAYIKYDVAYFEIIDTAIFIKMIESENLDSIAKTKLHNAIISPNDKFIFTNSSKTIFSQEKFISLNSKRNSLCIFSKIIYADFWGKEHYTSFCGTYTPPEKDNPNGVFIPFGKYNDMK